MDCHRCADERGEPMVERVWRKLPLLLLVRVRKRKKRTSLLDSEIHPSRSKIPARLPHTAGELAILVWRYPMDVHWQPPALADKYQLRGVGLAPVVAPETR